MPEDFLRCVRRNGRVITRQLKGGKYMHICYPQGGGSPVHGEVKQGKENK